MGNIAKKQNKMTRRSVKPRTIDDFFAEVAGTFTDEETKILRSGNGFVKVPTAELQRLRVDVYPYIM
jgi:hypothetical protein